MAAAAKDKGGGAGLLVPLIVVMAVGLGAGFAANTVLRSAFGITPSGVAPSDKEMPAAAHGQAKPEGGGADKRSANEPQLHIVPLDPVVVNLTGKDRSWIRLEGSVAFTTTPDKDKAILLAEMAEDIAGYLRGSSVSQLESAAGLESLREDLSELVQLRSKDRAVRFILRSLAIE